VTVLIQDIYREEECDSVNTRHTEMKNVTVLIQDI
jgi:hypothetical protein